MAITPIIHPTLYKKTSVGKVQLWWIEQIANQYRMHSGQEGGAIVASSWTIVKGKNKGRANETSPVEQATSEVLAKYTKKQKSGEYYDSKDDIGGTSRYFVPMLAKNYEPKRVIGKLPVYIQPKLNGIRCILTKDGMFSRRGEEFVNCPHIVEDLKDVFIKTPNLVLDGELYNHEFADELPTLASAIRKQTPSDDTIKNARELIEYHIYDCTFAGKKVTADFPERYEYLKRVFASKRDFCFLTETTIINDVYQIEVEKKSCIAYGYEGLIVRLGNAPYEHKRSYNLLKFKEFEDAEYKLLDVHTGKGNWFGYGKSVTLENKDGTPFDAGVKGDKTFTKDLLENKHKYIGKQATIRFQEMTMYGVPFHGRLIVIRDYE